MRKNQYCRIIDRLETMESPLNRVEAAGFFGMKYDETGDSGELSGKVQGKYTH